MPGLARRSIRASSAPCSASSAPASRSSPRSTTTPRPGFACHSFAALSLDPPLVLFCPTKASCSWAAIERSGRFAVNVLAEEQQSTCARFGSREPDKFAGIDWTPSPLGSPILTGSLAHIDCTVETVHDGGDHYVVFGRVHSMSEIKTERPLLFYRGQYNRHRTGQDRAGEVAGRPRGVPHHRQRGHLL